MSTDPSVTFDAPPRLDAEADVVVVGAGACGLVAALRARAQGAEVIVLERDASPTGSTSMSSGFVPAPATHFQRAIGVDDDTAARFTADIMAKSKGLSDAALAGLAARSIGPALEWLADTQGIDWIVLDDFLYPGHSRHRMHAVPEKTGAALLARLIAAAERADVPIVTDARACGLFIDDGRRVTAVEVTRPGGAREIIGCRALVLACNGFGGSRDLVRRHIPEIADGLYYGHEGNTGDALLWGEAIGAGLKHLTGYQGHGSLAHPHGILISWALMMEGGIQVNAQGQRFSNEHGGYSEQAVHVLKQPGGIAWNVYDERIHRFALGFPDYQEAVGAGAVKSADDVAGLARATGLPEAALALTLDEISGLQRGAGTDAFGRDFTGKPGLVPPYHAVKVTGALFHTQGGLTIGADARVLDRDGAPFPNLFAGGGAACGVSGPEVSGYLSGNGLLTAIAFGWLAGGAAARG
ncbi:FAD-dependent oxidoreductase [Polymorphum gilvum]|uniref:Fumarate reductase/succinate dehydrogenase flavoprotein-like protein n=1 Tax=Polymorphum gilvum (strain LMG 25793 / CGMCC 1.9160 / SL003B-26A1) TaxID=991905 RepID=F2J4J5_POLGS|nr:FAD-dependent oxidoreductase [Polymorphum gilvum]ADZ72247.1 Fumarate reductase/succinate dehydrogenase flavoprotein-like protein [Polymorphum gilvum SL003B-26A1]